MTRSFLEGLIAVVERFEATEARAGVLIGYEKFFSAGLALPELVGLDRIALADFMALFDRAMMRLFACERPIVAAINGHAIAGGCVLALMADVRLMSAGPLKIGLNETQLGIGLPSSVIEPLRAQLSAHAVARIAYEGTLFSPEEARGLGLVEEVVAAEELEPRALARAELLAKGPRAGVAQVKRAMRGPVLDAIRERSAEQMERWLDTWFSAPAQHLIQSTVARLKK